MCDNSKLDSKNISQCDFCGLNEVWSGLTISDYPVIKRGNDANPNYCIVVNSNYAMYYDVSSGRTVHKSADDNVNHNTNTNNSNTRPVQSTISKQNKSNNTKSSTNIAVSNNGNKGTNKNTTTKISSNNNISDNNANSNSGNNSGKTNTMNNNNTGNAVLETADNVVVSDKQDDVNNAAYVAESESTTLPADNTSVFNDGNIPNTNESLGNTDLNISNSDALDNSASIENGDDGGVSPILIGALSLFTILLLLVGFIFIRKRKQEKDDLDLIYRNSIFYATPIVEKNVSQNSSSSSSSSSSKRSKQSNKSNGSKNSLPIHQTAISSNNDGDFDIIISPTNAVTVNNDPVSTSRSGPGPINIYANTSVIAKNNSMFSDEQSSLNNTLRSTLRSNENYTTLRSNENGSTLRSNENGSTLRSNENGSTLRSNENYNQLNQTNGVKVTEAIASAYMSPDVVAPTNIEPNKIMAATAAVATTSMISNGSNREKGSPLSPAAVNVPNDANDLSVHEPTASFMNSIDNISYINKNAKEQSYLISPIMDKTVSNIYVANPDNSINLATEQKLSDSQLLSSPTLNNSTIKKSLSMVLSEYKEDSFYNAKFNYEPSMEDEMKIHINDKVLVKEIFNDGWAYGENKTTETCGIFPINRLDSSTIIG